MSRPKGVPNKISGQAKKNISVVFDKIGGIEKMATWAGENLDKFYTIYSKLAGTELNVSFEDNQQKQVDSLNDDEFKLFAQGIRDRIALSGGGGEEGSQSSSTKEPDSVH